MENVCDNKSVGVIIQNNVGEVLLLHRAKFPFGMAPPAGHIDDHGGPEQAAVTEVFEEVGLTLPIRSLHKVISDRHVTNRCRRTNGDHHEWTVYTAQTNDTDTRTSNTETTGCEWISAHSLQAIADKTKNLNHGDTKPGDRVLENIWLQFFVELGFVE